jgi:GTP cyclohydrolase I
MTKDIAEAVQTALSPLGVGVVIEASHMVKETFESVRDSDIELIAISFFLHFDFVSCRNHKVHGNER